MVGDERAVEPCVAGRVRARSAARPREMSDMWWNVRWGWGTGDGMGWDSGV